MRKKIIWQNLVTHQIVIQTTDVLAKVARDNVFLWGKKIIASV